MGSSDRLAAVAAEGAHRPSLVGALLSLRRKDSKWRGKLLRQPRLFDSNLGCQDRRADWIPSEGRVRGQFCGCGFLAGWQSHRSWRWWLQTVWQCSNRQRINRREAAMTRRSGIGIRRRTRACRERTPTVTTTATTVTYRALRNKPMQTSSEELRGRS